MNLNKLEDKMKSFGKILSAAALGLIMISNTGFAAGKGESGGQFLRIGAGARGPALAGAFAPIVDDATAIYWNPAGMAKMENKEVSVSYNSYFEDTNSQFIGYGHPTENGVFGLGLTLLGVSDIEKRSITGGDADIADQGDFDTRDMALSLGYARAMDNLSLGAAVKYISSDLEAESAATGAVDLGAMLAIGESGLSASLSILNLGGELKFANEGDPLPLNIKPGLAYKMKMERFGSMNFILDSDMLVHDGLMFIQLGIEWNLHRMMSLRSGYQFGRDDGAGSGFAAGAGFNILMFSLDYAFVPMDELGDTHRMAIGLKFGGNGGSSRMSQNPQKTIGDLTRK